LEEGYRNVVSRILPDVRRTAVIAFAKAIAAELELLENNYLEVASQLESVTDVIPHFADLMKIIKICPWNKIRQGLKLGNWLSGAYLQLQFGTLPTIGVIEELNRLGPKLADFLERNSTIRHRRSRGSFSFVFNDDELKALGIQSELHGRTLSLTTRVTTDYEFPDSPMFLALANLYAIGSAPSPAKLWELLPGSFAVDWPTNMSLRLTVAELSTVGLALLIRSVIVSYAFRISDPDWDSSLDPTASGNAWWSGYKRELLNSIPALAEGAVDYMRAAGGPPQAILAALLFQLSSIGR
jgi:hypothetical protein